MKKFQAMVILCVVLLAVVSIAKEKPWIDPKGCAICSKFSSEPGLMEHMKSEFLDIADGTVQVCQIDKEYQAAYKRASDAAGKVIADLQAGKEVPLDGYCEAIGAFSAAGVTPAMYHGDGGDVMILRSSDPEQLKKIREFATKTKAEMAKLSSSMASDAK